MSCRTVASTAGSHVLAWGIRGHGVDLGMILHNPSLNATRRVQELGALLLGPIMRILKQHFGGPPSWTHPKGCASATASFMDPTNQPCGLPEHKDRPRVDTGNQISRPYPKPLGLGGSYPWGLDALRNGRNCVTASAWT